MIAKLCKNIVEFLAIFDVETIFGSQSIEVVLERIVGVVGCDLLNKVFPMDDIFGYVFYGIFEIEPIA